MRKMPSFLLLCVCNFDLLQVHPDFFYTFHSFKKVSPLQDDSMFYEVLIQPLKTISF